MTSTRPKPTTTDAGIPVESDEHSLTVGPDGPILLQDHYLIEQMAQWNRERTPERFAMFSWRMDKRRIIGLRATTPAQPRWRDWHPSSDGPHQATGRSRTPKEDFEIGRRSALPER